MQTLSDQRSQLQLRITSILQPQLQELSDQMQAALFNCNHVTQPEYYQGLQNQHILLTKATWYIHIIVHLDSMKTKIKKVFVCYKIFNYKIGQNIKETAFK